MEPTDLFAVGCKLFRPDGPDSDDILFPLEQCRRNGIFRRNMFSSHFIPIAPFGRLFHRNIIFPTEKVTFSVGNSVGKIRLF